MARILQYIHRPNMTELGMGNTHDRYLVGPEDKLKLFFPLGVTTEVVDVYSNKKYSLYSKYENNEFRIKLMGDICDDYQMEPGDEVIFTRYESKEGAKTSLQIIECGRVFLNPGKRENGIIKDFEIVNIQKLPRFNKESHFSSEYSFLGEKHQIEIEFSETRRKRTDSPALTDFYSVKYDGKLLESKNNPIYYLSIRNNAVILKSLQKYEFSILLNEGNDEKKNCSTPNCLQQIFYGAPGTGKSHCIKDDAAVKVADAKNLVFRTTFHPDSDYSTFVGAYKPTSIEVPVMTIIGKEQMPVVNALPEKKIIYSFVPQAFLQAYVAAWNNPDDKVFLVIEEINRGNCAQIFGDLFQLLDREENGWSEYPIMADKDLAKYLNGNDETNQPMLTNKDGIKDGKLCLPKNLYIWATMNTSDQSLFPIDSAFKRRWDWVYMPIEDAGKNWKIEVNGHEYDWYRFLTAINKEVFDLTHSEDKQLGYFFAKAKDGKIDAATLVNKVYFYLWTDVFKDYDFESQKAFKKADGNEAIAFKEFFSKGKVDEIMAEQVLINLELNKPKEAVE